MTPNMRKVLRFLANESDSDDPYYYYSFAAISDGTDLERKDVRRACRALKRAGMAQFKIGLWTEDGEPAGSGYGITPAGRAAVHHNPKQPGERA